MYLFSRSVAVYWATLSFFFRDLYPLKISRDSLIHSTCVILLDDDDVKVQVLTLNWYFVYIHGNLCEIYMKFVKTLSDCRVVAKLWSESKPAEENLAVQTRGETTHQKIWKLGGQWYSCSILMVPVIVVQLKAITHVS